MLYSGSMSSEKQLTYFSFVDNPDQVASAFRTYDPRAWTDDLKELILLKTEMGFDIPHIFEDEKGNPRPGMPSIAAFYVMLRKQPEYEAKYNEAVRRKFEIFCDNMFYIVENLEPQRARLIQGHVKWMVERLSERYKPATSQKNDITITAENIAAAIVPPKELKLVDKPKNR